MKYYGLKSVYSCSDNPMGSGAEGAVYSTLDGKNVVKTFTSKAYLPEAKKRIEYMLQNHPSVASYDDGDPFFAWPIDMVFSGPGHRNFVGYVMPRLGQEYRSIIVALRPKERAAFFGKDSFRLTVALAYNAVEVFRSLQSAGYHISDMNPANILVNKKGHIVLIDCDSLSFTTNGMAFSPEYTTFNYLPPELQCFGKANTAGLFGEYSDRFMVALLIWGLLLWNTNPFQNGYWNGKKNGTLIPDNIAYGSAKWDIAAKGWPDIHKLLPSSTINLFTRCFGYKHDELVRDINTCIKRRPSLDEWHLELMTLLGLNTSSTQSLHSSNNAVASSTAPSNQGESKSRSVLKYIAYGLFGLFALWLSVHG